MTQTITKKLIAMTLTVVMLFALGIPAAAANETPVAQIGSTPYTDLHEAMTKAKSGETVELLRDVDLAGTEWEPVSFKGSFDGKGYTISNLTINKPGVSSVGFVTSGNSTIQNVTFHNPTVTGGENTGVVAGRTGGSAFLAKNIKVTGTIKVETTHTGYARAGVIVGGWAYGRYENITVDGTSAETSYIKHTGGGDGRYVAGIVGHADGVDAYINCVVKNISIKGGWLCGGIAGPGPSDGTASECEVSNIIINSDHSGGMFGWYYGAGTIEDASISDVTFVGSGQNNGAIGGYGNNTSATLSNVVYSNVVNDGGEALLNEGEDYSYTVSFDANKGEGSMADATYYVGGKQALPTATVTRMGYTFAGWNTKPDGSGTSYANGESVVDLADAGDEITLYAQWSVKPLIVKKHKVSFVADGRLVGIVLYRESQSELTFLPKVPAKEGYIGAWETYTLTGENMIVRAVYTPSSE